MRKYDLIVIPVVDKNRLSENQDDDTDVVTDEAKDYQMASGISKELKVMTTLKLTKARLMANNWNDWRFWSKSYWYFK